MPFSAPNADRSITAVWRRRGLAARLLYPFSLLFRALVAARRALYRVGVLRRVRMPVPVVVVGNINVGGTGKTPLTIHLAQALRLRGRYPGIISRGYRGDIKTVAEVRPDSDPSDAGDEPVLLARRSQCPVFVGKDRVAAARALLAVYPECNVILSDDGLQHYRLDRDVEIAMFDSRRLLNGWTLPAGPLREPMARLDAVDAIVINKVGASPAPTFARPMYWMQLHGELFYRLDDPRSTIGPAELAGKALHAVAGIGEPQRFFELLAKMGLSYIAHPFADHHHFRNEDFAYSGDAILTTEKDAVKLARLFLPLPVWVLPVTAEVNPDLAEFVLEKLNGFPSS